MKLTNAFFYPEFVHDTEMDKFLFSFNPRGFLKRLR